MNKRPAGRGEPILYLDFDGVLHPENVIRTRQRGPVLFGYPEHFLFENLEPLAMALDAHPSVSIVLSTSWVLVYRYSRTRRLLGRLAPKVIGATYHTHMPREYFQSLPRGLQVEADVRRRQPSAWLALDDDAHDWPAWSRDNLVHTDDRYGVRHPDVWPIFLEKLRGIAL